LKAITVYRTEEVLPDMGNEWRTDPIFTDHMVLQRNAEVPVWGTGVDGQRISVACGGKRTETVVSEGKWKAVLPPMEAGGPHELTVRTGDDTMTFTDVLIGDVWLAGGQSNMQWPLKDSEGAETEIRFASHPQIRYYDVPRVAYEDGVEWAASWKVCSPEHAGDFSAVAYHYAKQLQAQLGIPIGIVGCNFGATSASCWISEECLSEDTDLRVYLDEYREQVKEFDWEKHEEEEKRFQESFDAYNRRLEEGKTGGELGDLPWPPPMSPRSFMRPNGLYGTMLKRAVPYGIKGFLYYQGESDASKALLYDKLLKTLIDNWRTDWGNEKLPFLFVQLASFGCDGNPDGEDWALLRESQTMVVEQVPHTGMAVILDCGEEGDIHPRNKKTVGERLALVSLDRVYGVDIESSGPVYSGIQVNGDKAVLLFAHGEGLAAGGGGELTGFEIGARSGRFVPAQAKVAGDTVTLWSPDVPTPYAVRYGWKNYTEANLTNSLGLPAGPFRTDREGRADCGVSRRDLY
jgi:sialate O-acetylesterase